MAKKRKPEQKHKNNQTHSGRQDHQKPYEILIKNIFKEQIRSMRARRQEDPEVYDGLDYDAARQKRRMQAIMVLLDEVKSRAGEVCPDIPGVFSMDDEWAEINAFPIINETILARTGVIMNTLNSYQRTRENLDLTREEASELLVTMSPERIEKIENERSMPHPDEVLLMSDQYKQPNLCNYYCANQCPIGAQYVPEIKIKDLSQIVLETLASLKAMNKKRERLIEITVDGHISGDELADFVYIQEELEKISIAVETLQLWCERMLDTGVIDRTQYDAYKNG